MTIEIIFAISGAAIALLLIAKVWELKRKRQVLLLKLISRGDEHVRKFSESAVVKYSTGKEKSSMYLKKQLPMQTKNFMMKTNSFVKEQAEGLFGNMRNSRFLKKEDGLSEFFKNISDKEEGRIDETLENPGETDNNQSGN